MVNRNVYLSIATVGVIFALLTAIVEQPKEITFTILFLTLFILASIKWFSEWFYYRHYNAPLASAIFLFLPSTVSIIGSAIARSAQLIEGRPLLTTTLLEVVFDFSFFRLGEFLIFFNLFSLIFIVPPVIITIVVTRRYYSGRYPAIFLFRRRFPNTFVIIYNFIVTTLFFMLWWESGLIEMTGLLFIILLALLFINFYVMKIVIVPFRRITTSRARRRATERAHSSRPFFSWESPNSRETNRTSMTTRPTNRPSRSSIRNTTTVSVAPAVPISRVKTVRKLNPAILSSLRPAGQHLTEDDFRCIFCYEFPIEHDRQVVICPHCRHPSHANEFQKWSAVANICSRCNKPISSTKMIRLSGSNYERIINMFRKKQIK